MEKSNRVQIGILLGCLVVGLCLVGWMIANRGAASGRLIVVDPAAKSRPARPATRSRGFAGLSRMSLGI